MFGNKAWTISKVSTRSVFFFCNDGERKHVNRYVDQFEFKSDSDGDLNFSIRS